MRDYGFGDSTPYIDGPPVVVMTAPGPCPNCGLVSGLVMIEVRVKDHPLIRGGKGRGTYVGCPACPFATPMLIVALTGSSEEEQ